MQNKVFLYYNIKTQQKGNLLQIPIKQCKTCREPQISYHINIIKVHGYNVLAPCLGRVGAFYRCVVVCRLMPRQHCAKHVPPCGCRCASVLHTPV
jgi:hypothetical protein